MCADASSRRAGDDTKRVGERVLVQSCLRSLKDGDSAPFLGSDRDGGFAQYVAVPAADAFAIESPYSDAELATFPCAYGTAENLLSRCGVRAAEQVLVTGASGGVGSAAVQLAARRGAVVHAIVARDKFEAVRALGATHLIERDALLSSRLRAGSIDVIIDVVGGPQWPQLLDLMKPQGRYAVSGAIAGPIVELDLRKLYLKDLRFYGCTMQDDGVFTHLVHYIERGEIRPPLAGTYSRGDRDGAARFSCQAPRRQAGAAATLSG